MFWVIALMPDRRYIQLETDAQAIRRSIATSAGEILRTVGTVRAIFPPSFQVLFLLNMEETNPEALRAKLMSVLPACRQALGGMTLFMGVGKEVGSLDEVSDSYSGAEEAVQYAFVKQLTDATFRDEIIFPGLEKQKYAFDLDEEIMRALKRMEPDNAEEALWRYFERVSEYNHNQFVRNILHLDMVFQHHEIMLQIGSGDTDSLVDTATVSHWNAEDARVFFTQRVQQDISQLLDMKKTTSSGNELIEKIDRMIDENVFNPDFSIAQLADEFSFSVNYLRSLYKTGAGESLSARITRKRVEAACKLLDNTDESIENITMKLGFSTRNYFFTFFKKHMGMTPAQYRNR